MLAGVGGSIVMAIVVGIVGFYAIKYLMKLLEKVKGFDRLDPTVTRFVKSFIKWLLYIMLIIGIISVLGVPMAQVIAVLASAGVAIGLVLQGALSNLAGGILLMVIRPFNVGDYVDAAGASGVVQSINLFYTVLLTVDNKRITVPNGSLMNSNVVDYSTEELRRVDLTFSCAKGESPARIQEIMLEVMAKHEKVLQEGDKAPFARLSGGTNDAMNFAARAWCANEDYWDVFFDLTQSITEALGAAGVQAPAFRVVGDK
jgi:small conductance mechanosensitive channel